MRRILHALALLLGITLLAAEPASAAWPPSQKVASGSAAVVELVALENEPLSAERAGENVVLAYDLASDSPVAARGTTVIGRFNKVTGEIDGIGAGENSLLKHLPNQGSPKASWAQNSGVLRQEMNKGFPIRDTAANPRTGELVDYPGSFLNAERNLLRDRGWTYDPATTLWSPP